MSKLAWQFVPTLAVYIHRHYGDRLKEAFEKKDFTKLGGFGQLMQLYPGEVAGIPNSPSPLASMLVGGIGGAGLGLGLGWLGSQVLPRDWDRATLQRNAILAGAALGTLPGLSWGLINRNSGRPFFSNTVGSKPFDESQLPGLRVSQNFRTNYADFRKRAFSELGEEDDVEGVPGIDPDQFNQLIWQDPYVAGPLKPPIQAAASGLITGAANLPGKENSRLVTPSDVGRMAAGMGAGYLAGAFVGKTLGVLLGMPTSTQNHLKRTGAMAGLITKIVPLAFGG
jgi:hypothetical protein